MHRSRDRARHLALENGARCLELTGSSGPGLWRVGKKEGTREHGEREGEGILREKKAPEWERLSGVGETAGMEDAPP